jgi:hypothetical protein
MDYGLDGGGSSSCKSRDFSPLHNVQTTSGVHLASYIMCTEGSFPGRGERLGRVAYHSPPSSAEDKNGGAILPLPRMSSCVVLM